MTEAERVERAHTKLMEASDALYRTAIEAGAKPSIASHYAHDINGALIVLYGVAKKKARKKP